MPHSRIFDTQALVENLRLAVEYAANAGLLKEGHVLATLRSTEQSLSSDEAVDADAVILALNEVAQLIAPITLVDLRLGLNPMSAVNQRRSRTFQLWLTVTALTVLCCIGDFMHSLRTEQEALQAFNEAQAMDAEMKLTSLRKMAQNNQTMDRQSPLYDEFHRKIIDLQRINGRVSAAYVGMSLADGISMFPLRDTLPTLDFMHATAAAATATAPSQDASALTAGPPGAGEPEVCSEGGEVGAVSIPTSANRYPKWIRQVLADALSDFCFNVNLLSPDGNVTTLGEITAQLGYASHIRHKISLRVSWLLPFLYGLLGATMFLMRNVSNIRTPAMAVLPIVMRLSLGGVAGIVIGWFSAAGSALEPASALSLPFVLAFLTGYGVEALFALMDRLNRLIGQEAPPSSPKPA